MNKNKIFFLKINEIFLNRLWSHAVFISKPKRVICNTFQSYNDWDVIKSILPKIIFFKTGTFSIIFQNLYPWGVSSKKISKTIHGVYRRNIRSEHIFYFFSVCAPQGQNVALETYILNKNMIVMCVFSNIKLFRIFVNCRCRYTQENTNIWSQYF